MTPGKPTDDLGRWQPSDLRETARTYFGLGADADLPGPVRLLTAVDRIATLRRTVDVGDPTVPAVFLLLPSPPEYVRGVTTVAPMVDNGQTQLTSRVWFVNALVYRGRFVEFEYTDDDTLFRLVTDDLGSGAIPAVVYEPRTSPATLRFYPSGLDDADNCLVVDTGVDQEISLEAIFRVIDDIHANLLITPDAQDQAGTVWADSTRGVPVSDAEGRLQMHLRTGLTIAFLGCRVRKEQPGVPGRLDLQIERSDRHDPGSVTIYAVLELKALRAMWNSGAPVADAVNLEAVEKGVRQAATYRDDRNARAGALCCFDLRRDDVGDRCFDHVRQLAEDLGIRLRSWHLFWQAEDYRRDATA